MVQQQLLTILGSLVILLSASTLLSQDAPKSAPDPAGPPGRGPGPFGFGPFKRPSQSPGQPPGPPDHIRNWMADRALMLTIMEVPPGELEKQLAQWPRFQQMSEPERANFRKRLEGFRKGRRQAAMHAAKQMGIEIRPDREEEFLRDYWKGRRKIEETLFREMEPRRRELEGKFREEITGRYAPAPPQ